MCLPADLRPWSWYRFNRCIRQRQQVCHPLQSAGEQFIHFLQHENVLCDILNLWYVQMADGRHVVVAIRRCEEEQVTDMSVLNTRIFIMQRLY